MCVYSQVIDHFGPRITPWIQPQPGLPSLPWTGETKPVFTVDGFTPEQREGLRKLIKEFWEALKAAETVDRLTGQPDCEDPEKAKLKDRVRELEALLGERCAKHPTYQALRKPRAACGTCRKLWRRAQVARKRAKASGKPQERP